MIDFDFEERNNTLKVTRDDNGIQPIFVITVDDPQKVGDPIRSFTMYTVHTRVCQPAVAFDSSEFDLPDYIPIIPKVCLFSSPPLFRLPLAL